MKLIRAQVQDTYFQTLHGAIECAVEDAIRRGYQPISDSNMWYSHVNYGTTERFHVPLEKNNKPVKAQLHMSIYRMETGTYELTHYIN